MIGGWIRVPLEREPDLENPSLDRRALDTLQRCPDGATVLVDIGRREYVTEDAARWLNEHDHRLDLVIIGEIPEAVGRFVRAAREGHWSVSA